MKQKMILWICAASIVASGISLFTSCKRDEDVYSKKSYPVTDEERVRYAEKTMGIIIDPQQDWTLTNRYSVKVTADANLKDISQVAILNGNPYAGATILMAAKAVTNDGEATLSFLAPKTDSVLYAACMTADGKCIARPFLPGQDATVRFSEEPTVQRLNAPAVRRSPTIIQLNYKNYKNFEVTDFIIFRKALMTQLPDKRDNRDLLAQFSNNIRVRENPYNIYDLPMVFIGGIGKDNFESDNDNLGYLWCPNDNTKSKETFLLKDNFTNVFQPEYDNATKAYIVKGMYLLCRESEEEYTTLFNYGDSLRFQMAVGDELMEDAKERVKVFMMNGYIFAACEDGDDWDYNDRLFWFPNGAINVEETGEPFEPTPPEPQIWTYAWEDKDFGDYDMNDCVIEVQEHPSDSTKLIVTLKALGATRELWLGWAANLEPVFPLELHQVLRVPAGTMVNTGKTKADPVTVTVSKPAGFDFQTNSFVLGAKFKEDQQGIYDNDYYYIEIATKGKDPHGVVIPGKWKWPQEQICITNAYPDFAVWAQDITNIQAQDWYKNPVPGVVVNE